MRDRHPYRCACAMCHFNDAETCGTCGARVGHGCPDSEPCDNPACVAERRGEYIDEADRRVNAGTFERGMNSKPPTERDVLRQDMRFVRSQIAKCEKMERMGKRHGQDLAAMRAYAAELEEKLRKHDDAKLTEVIRKCGDKWCLFTKHKGKNGKHRRLGTHSSRAGAEAQERAIKSHGG